MALSRDDLAVRLLRQLSTVIAGNVEPDRQLIEVEVESMDLIEWLISVELEFGVTFDDDTFQDLDVEWTVRETCQWLAVAVEQQMAR